MLYWQMTSSKTGPRKREKPRKTWPENTINRFHNTMDLGVRIDTELRIDQSFNHNRVGTLITKRRQYRGIIFHEFHSGGILIQFVASG